jgi:lysosomal acid phosphatase
MNTQLVHNKTYAFRLPPNMIEQARSLADFHENGVFSDKETGGIGNSQFASIASTSLSRDIHTFCLL